MNEHRRIAVEPAETRARFSADEFERMMASGAFGDMKVELVGGELHRMPPPENQHSKWQMRVIARLLAHHDDARLRAEVAVAIGDDTIVGCDLAVLHAAVTDDHRLSAIDVALVVEIAVSSIGRDLGLKRALYAEAGIATYWVVDPERGVTHVYREPVGGEYRLVATTPFGEPLAVPGSGAAIVLA